MGKFILFLLAPVVILILLGLFLSLSRISGHSMEPNLKDREMVLIRRLFLADFPRRSQVAFYQSNGSLRVGRILAEPKESVRVQNGQVYIDNNAGKYQIEEEYLQKGLQTRATVENSWVKIGEFNYLIVPDNRQDFVLDLEAQQIHRNDITGVFMRKF